MLNDMFASSVDVVGSCAVVNAVSSFPEELKRTFQGSIKNHNA